MTPFRSSCPAVLRTTETFAQHVTLGGESKRLTFARAIVWLLMSESSLHYVHGGRTLQTDGTQNDFFGYLTSMNWQSPSPELLAKDYGIGPESSLHLDVVTTVYLVPVLEGDAEREENLARPQGSRATYMSLPSDWRVAEVVESNGKLPRRLDRIQLATAVTWSTKQGAEENAEVAARLRQAWNPEALQLTIDAALVERRVPA